MNCLFCDIVTGKINSYKLMEDEEHLAFLDLYPSVRAQTLVVPKKHFGSYVFHMYIKDYLNLMRFTQKVSKAIDSTMGSIRTCMVMEGMEINHAHIKLYPIYQIGQKVAEGTVDLSIYPGYISTKHGKRASETDLESVIREFNNDKT